MLKNCNVKVNEQIFAEEIRLIDINGNQVGIVSLDNALKMASELNYDLVEISSKANPPVCKIMNYGKFIFNLNKKYSESKKKQKKVNLKEIKFRPTTDERDYLIKLRNIIRFLKDGDKVKITLKFRGRELSHQDIGISLLDRLQKDSMEYGVVEQKTKREGRQLLIILGPKK
ncbi:translation initiation factor IF-3 [Candidatus Legionella polyplacis]|uniref:Translation initiation factor IF-3 n=1 Tax=Candidatus Legionella polyplacis TaxID=2005262 RepID=A0ABZ2GWG4_9GAMM|nr:translation initiation factor IF-3 [Candidatus Legionella polyplacis]